MKIPEQPFGVRLDVFEPGERVPEHQYRPTDDSLQGGGNKADLNSEWTLYARRFDATSKVQCSGRSEGKSLLPRASREERGG